MARFGRLLSAMVTPFAADGSLDLDAAAQLARWLEGQGHEGLVIAGTTGESPTLTHDEQIDLVAAVVEAVNVPVVAGAGSNDTAAAIELTQRSTEVGAAGILIVTPYYNRPSQVGIEGHFRAVAAATELPIMIYDHPGRTGRKIHTDVLLKMAHEIDNVLALKDAAGNPGETASVIAQAPAGFEVYSGDDVLNLPLLAVGAVGIIGVATHWTSAENLAMLDALEAGDLAEAREWNAAVLPSFDFESSDDAPNPIPTKCVMRLLGLPVGYGRPPMDVEPADLEAQAQKVLAGTIAGQALGS